MSAQANLETEIEAILFVAAGPVKLSTLIKVTGVEKTRVIAAINSLKASLDPRGIRLAEDEESYVLVTSPAASRVVESYQGGQIRAELSHPALETLAIIAYRQPVTKSQIDEIRGVSSEQTLKNLLFRGLIVEAGTADTPGRPTLFATSPKFLHHFGITSRKELPPLEDIAEPGHEN